MIYDNLLLAHDLVEKIRKTRRWKTWLVAYKVDMNKVYDKTDRGSSEFKQGSEKEEETCNG